VLTNQCCLFYYVCMIQKSFLFYAGKELAKWLQDHLCTDINEAQQLGLMLCHLGYVCPVLSDRDRSISFKADASLYRFQVNVIFACVGETPLSQLLMFQQFLYQING